MRNIVYRMNLPILAEGDSLKNQSGIKGLSDINEKQGFGKIAEACLFIFQGHFISRLETNLSPFFVFFS